MSNRHHSANPTPGDFAVARDLAAEGWHQVSSNYRLIARLPEGMTGLEALETIDPNLAQDIREQAEAHAMRHFLRMYAEHKELTPEQFRAFKLIHGKVA